MSNELNKKKAERWAWILIYGGLLMLVFSIFLARYERMWAIAMQMVGAISAVGGAALIWLRSRMK